ncbi:MAG: methyltransferase domain-containing protein [Verrucomicrobiota bacterium]|nr:methyltransferase domain-containing protein [Verrucomicrobiota bacterium]
MERNVTQPLIKEPATIPLPESLSETLSVLEQLEKSFSKTEGYAERSALHFRIEQVRRHALRMQLSDLFTDRNRIVLEIGCGHGHFLTAYADLHRELPCVGIDLINKRIVRAEVKRTRRGLSHLRFLKAEASEFFDELPPSVQVQRYFVLFADPWPKKRHWKNRLLQPAHLELLANRALPGAELYFRTDHGEFYDWVKTNISESPHWRLAPELPWPFEEKTVFQGFADSFQSLCAVKSGS